ncbi:MAG TPA: choice-of-anchor X domain-containing protein [Ignavibacteriaceae bacterium]|nr:choice-of-anchor X domain-containing protein [Ignavibacteriaceae bacterium]
MKTFICFSFVLLFAGFVFGQPKDILVNWECNMEIEILSGRFNPSDTVAARGNFNGWGRHDLIVDPLNPNYYISEFPDLIYNVNVGDPLVEYKFFYTPAVWEIGNNKVHILTQEEYNAGEATVSRAFNDATLATVTNQETTIQFTVDCNGAVSAINGQPFPVINTCHLAGGTAPLQWPSLGWPDNEIYLMIPMYDDGTNGDPTAGDDIFNALVTFPPYTVFSIQYKYGINYGDWVNNGGGNDNENYIGANHIIELEQLLGSAQVLNVFGTMGLHQLINQVYVPVELTSFTASVQSGVVSLNWTTATELNNLGFELERKIITVGNEGEWLTIGFLKGNGTTTEPKAYSYTDQVGDIEATAFKYRLKQVDFDGSFEYSDEVTVENSEILPAEYFLSQNYPNPFNPSTKISWQSPVASWQTLKIYDVLGNEVATLVDEYKPAGKYEIEFEINSDDGQNLSTGVYFYQLRIRGPEINSGQGIVETKKMILLK